MKMLRQNVLINVGKTVNILGAELIETPDKYKRLSSIGEVVSVGPKCKRVKEDDIGKRCVVGITRDIERRLNPETSEGFGLDRAWHFIVHENLIESFV